MLLDFGNKNGWSASNFVLIDGKFAPFQPKSNFNSIPSVNLQWLSDKDITLNLPKTTTSSGLFVFNSASVVELYYNNDEIKGER